MNPDLLDVAFPPADPAALVADVRAAGARAVGLYVINWSAPATVVSAAYAQAVYARGTQVLPIITPGQNPPPVSGVPDVLRAWGRLNSDNAVAQDIEQPGISTPPVSWVRALADALLAAGYDPWTYTNLPAYFGIGRLWAVDWDHGAGAVIPAGAVAVQWSPEWRGPSGSSYDPNYLIPSALGGTPVAFTDEFNAMVSSIPGVGGQAEPGRTFLAALLGGVRDEYNMLTTVNAHLPTVEASVAAIEKAINAASGHPADAPILAAVADAKAAIDAIRKKTDKDLA